MATAVTIPLARSHELLVLDPRELSDDIIRILQRENVNFEIWLNCARGLLSQGRVDDYIRLLKSLINEVQQRPNSAQTKFIHVQAICSLADLYQQQSRLTEDTEQKRQLTSQANALYFSAIKVDTQEMLPHIGIGEQAFDKVRME